MNSVGNSICFGSDIKFTRNGPDLANHYAIDNVVGNLEMPMIGGIASCYR